MRKPRPVRRVLALASLGVLGGVVLVGLLGLQGLSPMEDLYEKEVRDELARTRRADRVIFTEAAVAHLPAPVRRHLQVCGWMGRKAPVNARVVWSDFRLKMARGKPFMPLSCRQFNAAQEPVRIAFMGGKLAKVIPFEGRDKYQEGQGHMLVKVGGLFNAVDEKSRKMDQSGLVTVLAETFLLPSYVLQPYIRWEEVDSLHAKATLAWNGLSVSGVFAFAPTGENIRFTSEDRWQQGNDSATIPWSGIPSDYVEKDGLRFAGGLSAVWHEKGGDFEYVRGRIDRIDYDVQNP